MLRGILNLTLYMAQIMILRSLPVVIGWLSKSAGMVWHLRVPDRVELRNLLLKRLIVVAYLRDLGIALLVSIQLRLGVAGEVLEDVLALVELGGMGQLQI